MMRGYLIIWKAKTSPSARRLAACLRPFSFVVNHANSIQRTQHRSYAQSLHLKASDKRAFPRTKLHSEDNITPKYEIEDEFQSNSQWRSRHDTLTDSERAIFQQIYQDAAEKSALREHSEEGRVERLIGETFQEQYVEEPLSTFFDRARDAIRQNHKNRDRPPGLLEAHRSPESDPTKLPPELLQNIPQIRSKNLMKANGLPRQIPISFRQSLQLAPGWPEQSLTKSQAGAVSSTKQDPTRSVELSERDVEIVEACNRDANHLDSLLQSAGSDTEIWRILQKEVFAQVELFQDAMRSELERVGDGSSTKKRGRRPKQAGPELSSIRALSIATGPEKHPHLALPFAVIRANYAYHCWAAVRILRVDYPRSPYATAVLPTIKSLGPISYVLGASTELYNELLFLRWAHYKDLQACADLLAEMLNRGIPTSDWTRAVFGDAAKRWLAARKQLQAEENEKTETAVAGATDDTMPPSEKEGAKKPQVRAFELAWWSLEGVQSGFKRWEALEVEARRRQEEEKERRKRAERDAEEDDQEGEEDGERPALAQANK